MKKSDTWVLSGFALSAFADHTIGKSADRGDSLKTASRQAGVGTVKTDGHALGEAAVRMNMRSRIVTIVTEPGLPPIPTFPAFLPVQVVIAKKSCSP